MSTQNANAVAITGGNVTITTGTANNFVANGNIQANTNFGLYSVGNLSYSDTGIAASFSANINSYVQIVTQNLSNGTGASTDYVVVNDTGTAYSDWGISSSKYSGSGGLNQANIAYLFAGSTELYVGTSTANSVHFIANNSNTDAMVINSNNTVTINTLSQSTSSNATFATSSLPLVPAGYLIINLNGTNVKIPYYGV
jgi:hypothetical protein